MTRLERIEKEITTLSPEEVRELADWFAEYQADLWDRQIERDTRDGKLEKHADTARAHHRAGRTTPL